MKTFIIFSVWIYCCFFLFHSFCRMNIWTTTSKIYFMEFVIHQLNWIKRTLWGLRQFLATESSLKIMKNTFCFTLKPLFLLKIFNILTFWSFQILWCHSLVKQTFVIHILSSVLRNKGSETVKLGQLIECNMRSIFFEKSYTKCGGETSPRSFPERLKLSISLNQ